MNTREQVESILRDVVRLDSNFPERAYKWHFDRCVQELLDILDKQINKTFDRFHLYGIDFEGVEQFIDSDLSVEGSRKRARDYMRAFPQRYEKMLMRTTNGDFSEVVENGN